MYFEVSGRQTGKTRRLLNDLLFNVISLKDNIKYIIFCPNYGMKQLIKDKISKALLNVSSDVETKFNQNVIYISSNEELNKYILSLELSVLRSEKIKIYIDEIFNSPYLYDVLFQWLKRENINKNLYCCGTPSLNDIDKKAFNKLKSLNKGKVITMKWFSEKINKQEFLNGF